MAQVDFDGRHFSRTSRVRTVSKGKTMAIAVQLPCICNGRDSLITETVYVVVMNDYADTSTCVDQGVVGDQRVDHHAAGGHHGDDGDLCYYSLMRGDNVR